MHVTLEYIAIGVMLILFISVSLNVANEIATSAANIRAEQLYSAAERIIDKILLTPGVPVDWGSNVTVGPNDVVDFGLALNGTRTPYEIDPDKVMRLANLSTLPNPLLMNSSRLSDLLGISDEYGFRLEMHPLMREDVQIIDYFWIPGNPACNPSLPVSFNVSVKNWYDFSIPGANVTGIYVLVKITPGAGNQPPFWEKVIWVKTNITNVKGWTILDFSDKIYSYFSNPGGPGGQHWYVYFLLLHVNWYGFVSVSGFSKTIDPLAPVEGYIIGDAIIINRTVEGLGGAFITKDEVIQALPEYESLLTVTEVEWCRWRPDDPEWCRQAGNVLPPSVDYLIGHVKYIEKLSSHVFVFGRWRGCPIIVVINRIPDITIVYGSSKAEPANSVVLTRLAQVYNYPYIVRLTLWRKTEGWP